MPTSSPATAPPAPPARRAAALRLHRPWTPWAFVLPALLVLATFVLAAMLQVVCYSFTRYTAFRSPQWVGLENYRRALLGTRFWACLANSAIYLAVTPAIIAASLAAALVVHSALRGARALQTILFLPVVTPTIVGALAWRLLFNDDQGLINATLKAMGLPAVKWLTAWPWPLISAMIVTLWKGFGYYMMVFLAGLIAVPRELEEAAVLDGAGRWDLFRHVTLPALRPVLALVFVVSSISALKVFDEVYITAGGVSVKGQTVVPLIYRTAFIEGDYGLASAMGVLLFLILLAFSLVNLRQGRQ